VRYRISLFLPLFLLSFLPLRSQGLQENDPTLWPESERAFLQDGPGLLLTTEQRTELRGFNPEARARWIQDFLNRTPGLQQAIARRRQLASDQYLSPQDVRAQLTFLNGQPDDKLQVDCGAVFRPLEIWSYRSGTGPDGKPAVRQLVVYRPGPGEPYHLWLPSDAKRVLYVPNQGHGLRDLERVVGAVSAAHRYAAAGRPLPSTTWSFATSPRSLDIGVQTDRPASRVLIWSARSDTPDFRDAHWSSSECTQKNGKYVCSSARGEKGYTAVFAETAFSDGDDLSFSTSTTVCIAGPDKSQTPPC